jgi:Mg2+-importing ATPase
MFAAALLAVTSTIAARQPAPTGLSAEAAARRLVTEGPNSLGTDQGRHWAGIFVGQFRSPLVLVLVVAAGISHLLGERVETGVILVIVAVNALLGFAQEYRAQHAVRLLRRLVTRTARVVRDGSPKVVPAESIVRGDLVELEVGDLVPADLVLSSADALSADESALTGESVPVSKRTGDAARLGTAIVSGYGSGIVTATGRATELGRTARLLERRPTPTEFEQGIRRFSDFLVVVILALTSFVFLVNAVEGKGWLDSFLFALALAVGITPEVLPIIVTLTLARGALRMARNQVVVKRLAAVEDLGNIDLLCCDKTGTLTTGEFTLRDYHDIAGARDPDVLRLGALAGVLGRGRPGGADNPTDRAIWRCAQLDQDELAGCEVLDRNPFDFTRRRGSALLECHGRRVLAAKGAADAILPVCDGVRRPSGKSPLGGPERADLRARVERYEEDGYRVLAVAERDLDQASTTGADEIGLTLLGFLLFMDPPKADVGDALASLNRLGVELRVLTGDSPAVARRICREVGLPEGPLLTGPELALASAEALPGLALGHAVFARVDPEQKHRLVTALRAHGHVVGFLGDGVNDAPALRAADVGVAVASGTDIAKEAADVILLQKSLAVLAGGIVEGRTTFANITKYILNTVSANFGNMATVAAASLFLRFIPLLPSQILLNNLLSDLPLLAIATDRVDTVLLQRPRHWRVGVIARFMVLFGVLSAVFDLLLIGLLLARTGTPTAVFRTAWFLESVLSELLVTFALRSRDTLLRSRPGAWLLWSSIAAGVAAIAIVGTPAGRTWFGFAPVPAGIALMVAGVLAAYLASADLLKRRVFGRFEL